MVLGDVAVEGTVTDKLEMRPHGGIEEYGKLCQERNRKHVAEARHTQVGCSVSRFPFLEKSQSFFFAILRAN